MFGGRTFILDTTAGLSFIVEKGAVGMTAMALFFAALATGHIIGSIFAFAIIDEVHIVDGLIGEITGDAAANKAKEADGGDHTEDDKEGFIALLLGLLVHPPGSLSRDNLFVVGQAYISSGDEPRSRFVWG
jgi:hypothetical protein